MKKIYKLNPKKLSFRDKIIVTFLVLILIAAGFIAPLILSQKLAGHLQQQALGFIEGEIADKNIIAKTKIQYIDFDATEMARQSAVQNIKPKFTLSLEETLKILSLFDHLKISLIGNEIENLPDSVFSLFSKADLDLFDIDSNFQTFSMQDKIRLLNFAEQKLKSILDSKKEIT